MKCMLCGIENRDEALRCKGCGAQLSSAPRGPLGRTPAPTVLENSGDVRQGAAAPTPSAAYGTPTARPEPPTRRTRIATPEELAGDASPRAAQGPAGSPAQSSGSSSGGHGSGGHSSGGHSKTVYKAPDADDTETPSPAGRSAQASAGPRLFGFLVTYTWNASGQFFPLREGKNTVGSESGLDASIPADRAMSGKHFTVMYRRGEVRVRDLDSTNATVVDGEEVWGDSVAAGHGATIKAGDTTFQLVIVPTLPGAP